MLKFLGTGSAFNEELGNTSAYVKEEGTLLLIDCGETVFSRIKETGLLDDVQNVYIAITHNHSDHIGSLASLIEYLSLIKGIVPNIVLTNDDSAEVQEQAIHNYLENLDVNEEMYEFVYGDMMEDVLTDLVKIEMPQVKHSKRLTSYAVELCFKDRTVYYTGDNKDASYLKKIAKKLGKDDLVYTDCSLRDYSGSIHITLDELAEIFQEEQRSQVTCMHFDSFNTYGQAKDLGFKVATRELSKAELIKQIANRK